MIRRIFSRSSILTLFILIVGLLGAFGLPQQIGIADNQLIMALLAATGLELLIERVGHLSKIDEAIEDVRNLAGRSLSADTLFLARSRAPSFEDMIVGAEEVWIAGKSLHGLLNNHGSYMLSSGTKYRLLAHDPKSTHIAESFATQSFSNPSVASLRSGLVAGAEQLTRMRVESQGRVSARLSTAMIPNGFTIVDPSKPSAVMRIELFSFKVSLGSRRSVLLRRSHEPATFDFYLDQYVRLWDAAAPTPESVA